MSDLTAAASPLANVAPLESITADEIGIRSMAPSLAILLNPSLYERAKAIAVLMSKAQGLTPNWLIGKGEACFSVVTMALDWKLSWHFVARHTYQTPGGSIGFDGALVQSILEASNRFIGAPSFQYTGDWRGLAGKFRMQEGQRGGKFPVATWTDEDAVGLGVIVRWQIKGEPAPRVWPGEDDPFWLVQCQPRNSPLWATDPKTQIRYLAIRRFANMTAPGILGSASFDREELIEAADLARDITPAREPQRTDYGGAAPYGGAPIVHDVDEAPPAFEVVALDGEVFDFETLDAAIDAARTVLESARRGGPRMLDAAIENNQALIAHAFEEGADLIAEFRPDPAPVAPPPGKNPAQEPARAPQSAMNAPPAQTTSPAPAPHHAPPPAAATPANEDRQQPEPEERRSMAVVPPLARGRPDWRTWVRALMIAKVRQQTTEADLAFLLGDNAENLQSARAALSPSDMADFDAEVDAAWKRLRPGQ